MPTEAIYKGFKICSYLSPRQQWRWIYEEHEYIDPVAEFNLKEKHVSIDECKRIIDGWVKDKENRKAEQMTLF